MKKRILYKMLLCIPIFQLYILCSAQKSDTAIVVYTRPKPVHGEMNSMDKHSMLQQDSAIMAGEWNKTIEGGPEYIVKILPEVKCINKILDTEIRYFLSQQKETHEDRYWDLRVRKLHDKFDASVLYRCGLANEMNHIPSDGIAYMQYGKEIIMILKDLDETLFKKVDDSERVIGVVRNRYFFFCSTANLSLLFSENKLLAMNAEYHQ